jgi:hypothetical protein
MAVFDDMRGLPSMLLAFRTENARSFRRKIELSLLSTRLSRSEVVRHIPWREDGSPIGVLPAAGIFGANASGKSNLLRAMADMRALVLLSFRVAQPDSHLPTKPFRLAEEEREAASTYEVDLVLDGVRHEYGFTLNSHEVIEEWAHHFPRGRKALLFHRAGDRVEPGRSNRAKTRATEAILSKNALFLSTAAATEHPALSPLYAWFLRNFFLAEEKNRSMRQAVTAERLESDATRERALALMKEGDFGITGANKFELEGETRELVERAVETLKGEVSEVEGATVAVRMDDVELRLKHRAGARDVELRPDEESRGTLVWLGMIGPVLDVLEAGSVLLADELDASLHPALVSALVRLFQSERSNPRRAQLIFNSHDVTLMGDSSEQPLGRDQIWFTEKGEDGSTDLYPLTDLDPRKGEAVGRRYLAGRYGATPIVSIRHLEGVAAPKGDDD